VRKIGHGAFHRCFNLKEVLLNEGLETIGSWTFLHCTSMESLVLPSSMKEIGEDACYNCTKLKTLVLNEGLVKIGKSAIGRTAVETLTLPSTITEIGVGTFSFCDKLKRVVFKEGLESIGAQAFGQCTSLKSLALPSTVRTIGHYAFSDCLKMEQVVLNDGLESFGKCAFHKCTSLERVSLHHSVFRAIKPDAFAGCNSLERLTFPCLSNRLRAISAIGQRDIETKISETDGVELRHGEVSIAGSQCRWGRTAPEQLRIEFPCSRFCRLSGRPPTYLEKQAWLWGAGSGILLEICDVIAYNEFKDATTIVDLALWKARIEEEGRGPVDRMACRVEVPGPARDTIVAFLQPKASEWSSIL